MNKMLINMYIVHAQNQSTDQMNSGNGLCENTKLLVLFIFILTVWSLARINVKMTMKRTIHTEAQGIDCSICFVAVYEHNFLPDNRYLGKHEQSLCKSIHFFNFLKNIDENAKTIKFALFAEPTLSFLHDCFHKYLGTK